MRGIIALVLVSIFALGLVSCTGGDNSGKATNAAAITPATNAVTPAATSNAAPVTPAATTNAAPAKATNTAAVAPTKTADQIKKEAEAKKAPTKATEKMATGGAMGLE